LIEIDFQYPLSDRINCNFASPRARGRTLELSVSAIGSINCNNSA